MESFEVRNHDYLIADLSDGRADHTGPIPVQEEHLPGPDSALGQGYAESKWVSEQILKRAAEQTPIRTRIIRCGQLAGGPSGAWNEHEWFPSLIKSSILLRKLPTAESEVSWISASAAARVIVDTLRASDTEPVLHLVHPHPAHWNAIIHVFSSKLGLQTVDYAEWFSALEASYGDVLSSRAGMPTKLEGALRASPALRLLDFFRAGTTKTGAQGFELPGIVKLSCDHCLSVSKTLREVETLGEADAARWIEAWKRSGFI